MGSVLLYHRPVYWLGTVVPLLLLGAVVAFLAWSLWSGERMRRRGERGWLSQEFEHNAGSFLQLGTGLLLLLGGSGVLAKGPLHLVWMHLWRILGGLSIISLWVSKLRTIDGRRSAVALRILGWTLFAAAILLSIYDWRYGRGG